MTSIKIKNSLTRAYVALRYLKRDAILAFREVSGVGDSQSWKRFHREVRSHGCNLLKKLSEYPDAVLVTGCQRSGTTMLARMITQSNGMTDYPSRRDDELDAALILSGYESHQPRGRYCFQTTYVNQCYQEYFNPAYNYKMIWVLRNPFSVIYSMKYNWSRFSFDELFEACGHPLLRKSQKDNYQKADIGFLSKTYRACYAYNGKQLQAIDLISSLGSKRMLIVEYDEMVLNRHRMLPEIYSFLGLPYKREYAEKIHEKSVNKAESLSRKDKEIIDKLCMPVYQEIHKSSIKC
jgi:hypothetical protein